MSAASDFVQEAYDYAAENELTHAEALWEINQMELAVMLIVACPCCPADNNGDAIFHGTGGWSSVEACYGPIPDEIVETLSDEDKDSVLRQRMVGS
jgi:hypothetical protein